ncbi:LPD29 domain-containing protein [Asaia bogorensis]|uniref:Uncharacterized protein n=1 Tax=Asaia bogorensis NBRC 16594 TaxID=1231624 RepID=A0AAN4R5D2_9PROT|nr:LPD29 domain-containing protein [Asaia bogorensis]GBQ81718.1 hypothetical protein AA0311_2685 [Asaia bogorensis NBRC 16594]GEL54787.1 hypothetical protein ABO01nite_27940 [Asaia bogorensis NBRC 16594]
MSDTAHTLEVGTMVSTGLYGRGIGYITAIYGEQKPETIERFLGCAIGGQAEFDIVFEYGGRSMNLPECILHDEEWKIFPKEAGFADTTKLAELEKAADVYTAAKDAEERVRSSKFARAVEDLKADPAYADLEQGGSQGGGLAVKNIRKLLKAAFKTTKFSIRNPEEGCIYVRWRGGPSEDQVSEITDRFRNRPSEHSTDWSKDGDTPWNKTFGGAEYVFTSRSEA